MIDEDDGDAMAEDFDPASVLAAPLMRTVLEEVQRERQRQDGELGMFRDYPDGTAGRAIMGPTASRDREGQEEAQRRRVQAGGKVTWRHLLDEAAAGVVAEGKETKLRAQLVALAAVSVSWVEAIDRRKDEKRIEAKIHAQLPLFERIRQWWKAWRRTRRSF